MGSSRARNRYEGLATYRALKVSRLRGATTTHRFTFMELFVSLYLDIPPSRLFQPLESIDLNFGVWAWIPGE